MLGDFAKIGESITETPFVHARGRVIVIELRLSLLGVEVKETLWMCLWAKGDGVAKLIHRWILHF